MRCDPAFLGERLNRAAVEDLAFDCSDLEHGSLRARKLVETGGHECLESRRDDNVGVALARDRDHLGDEERVSTRRPCDLPAQLRGQRLGEQLSHLLVRQRLQPERSRPLGPPLGQLRPREAKQEERRAGRKHGDPVEEVEKRLLSPVDIVEDDHQRRLLCEHPAERPGDLFRRRPVLGLASSDRSAAAAAGSEGNASSCFRTSTTGR